MRDHWATVCQAPPWRAHQALADVSLNCSRSPRTGSADAERPRETSEDSFAEGGPDTIAQNLSDPRRTPQFARLDVKTLSSMSAASAYSAVRLAARLGISPRHLRRLFVKQFGRSPNQWLREERLQAALRLLPSAASVKEVACALGFRSPSQFGRDFLSRFGCRPSELLRRRKVKRRFFSSGD